MKSPTLIRYLVIAAVLQIVWGFTPTASKLVIDEIPVELYITLRWTIAGLIFVTYLAITRTWQKISLGDFWQISLLGIMGYGLASFGTLYGLKLGGVSNFALMASISPIITTVLSIFILKEKPKKKFYLALLLTLVGLSAVVIGKYQVSTSDIALGSALLIIGSYICEGLVFVFSKKFKTKVSTSQYLAIAQVATAGLMWLAQGAYFHQTSQFSSLTPQGLSALIFVSIVACVLCFAILYWLLNHVDGHKLSLFDSVHTVSAVFFGYLIFNDEIGVLTLSGGIVIVAAIILANWPQSRSR